MKKIFALVLVLCMVVALVACSGAQKPAETKTETTETKTETTETKTEAKTGSVYWLNFKPESDEVLQQVA